jgi:hypothetical protein
MSQQQHENTESSRPVALPIYNNSGSQSKIIGFYDTDTLNENCSKGSNEWGSTVIQKPSQIDWTDFLSNSCNCDCCGLKFNILNANNRTSNKRSDLENVSIEIEPFALDSNRIVDTFGVTTTATLKENERRKALSIKDWENLPTVDKQFLSTQAWTKLGTSVTNFMLGETTSSEEGGDEEETEEVFIIDETRDTNKRSKTSINVVEVEEVEMSVVPKTLPPSLIKKKRGDYRRKCQQVPCERYAQGRNII